MKIETQALWQSRPQSPRRKSIIGEMSQNPYVTKPELSESLCVSTMPIDNNIF